MLLNENQQNANPVAGIVSILTVLALALQQDDTHSVEAVSVALIVHEWEDIY